MTQPLETAYVEIIPDFSGFSREVRQDLRVELARLEVQMREVGNHIERQMADIGRRAGTRLGNEIQAAAKVAASALDSVGDQAAEMGRDIVRGAVTGRNGLQAIARSGILSTLVGGLGEVAKGAGEAFTALGSKSPLLLAGAIALLIPAVIGLAAALADLIGLVGLLPSGFLVLLAAIVPLIVAFQNFGDALSAVASGDIDKINEALAKLSPSAAQVAREIGTLLPNLRLLQRHVQEAFFFPLRGALPQLVEVLLPSLIFGMGQVSGAFGRLLREVIEFFSLPENITLINNLFATTARIIDSLSPSLVKFLVGFLEVGNTALPIFEKLSNIALTAFGEFGDFLAEAARTGELDKFIDEAVSTARELLNLFKEIGALLKTVFDATDEEGRGFIQTLADLTSRLNEFLKTPEGQRALEDLVTTIGNLGVALGIVLGALTGIITLNDKMEQGILKLSRTLRDFFQPILRDLGLSITTFGDDVVATFTGLPDRIGALAEKFANAGKNLISSFIGGFRRAGNFIGDVAGDITGHIKGGLNTFIRKINAGIEGLDNILPFSLSRIPLLQGGGLALGPSMIAEHGQQELALPLNDPRAQRAIQQAIGDLGGGGPTINFGPGSININFDGVVPSEQEARTVGNAVGHGIIDTLTRQGIRMSIRAI